MGSGSVDMSFFAPLNLSMASCSTRVVDRAVPDEEVNHKREISFADETGLNLPLTEDFEFDADSVHSESSFEDWVTFIAAGDPDDDCSWFTDDESLEETATTEEYPGCENGFQPDHVEGEIMVFECTPEYETPPLPPSSGAKQGLALDSSTEQVIEPREKKSHKHNEESWKKKLEGMVIDEYAKRLMLPIKEEAFYERPDGFLGNSEPKVEKRKVKLRTSWLKSTDDEDEAHAVSISKTEALKGKTEFSLTDQPKKLQRPDTESRPKEIGSSKSRLVLTDLSLATRALHENDKRGLASSFSSGLDYSGDKSQNRRKVTSSRSLKGCDFMSASWSSMSPNLEKLSPQQKPKNLTSSMTAVFEGRKNPIPEKEKPQKVSRISSLPASIFEAFTEKTEKETPSDKRPGKLRSAFLSFSEGQGEDRQQPVCKLEVRQKTFPSNERRNQVRKLSRDDKPEKGSPVVSPAFEAFVGSKSLALLATPRSSDRSSRLTSGSKRHNFAGRRPTSLHESPAKRDQELVGQEKRSVADRRAIFARSSSVPQVCPVGKQNGSLHRRSVDAIEEEQ